MPTPTKLLVGPCVPGYAGCVSMTTQGNYKQPPIMPLERISLQLVFEVGDGGGAVDLFFDAHAGSAGLKSLHDRLAALVAELKSAMGAPGGEAAQRFKVSVGDLMPPAF